MLEACNNPIVCKILKINKEIKLTKEIIIVVTIKNLKKLPYLENISHRCDKKLTMIARKNANHTDIKIFISNVKSKELSQFNEIN